MPCTYNYQLPKLDSKLIDSYLKNYEKEGGGRNSEALLKLFNVFDKNSDKYEVAIKVAALNTLYSTAIRNIQPVVDLISEKIPPYAGNYAYSDFIDLVDMIAQVSWVNSKNENKTRKNLSFASKYIHFLSNRELPIYDSYNWFVLNGFIIQKKGQKTFKSKPENYKEFHNKFMEFKDLFNLGDLSNYHTDKFLWQFGKVNVQRLMKAEKLGLNEAKRRLISRIKGK